MIFNKKNKDIEHDEHNMYPSMTEVHLQQWINTIEPFYTVPYLFVKRCKRSLQAKYSSLWDFMVYYLIKGTVYDLENRD